MQNRTGWRDRRVLVTGATGFIGSNLAMRLGSLGAEVHAVTRHSNITTGNHIWHVAELRDPDATIGLVEKVRPEVVFHLASTVTGARDVKLVVPTLQSNLNSAVNVLTAATAVDAKVVLAGSIEEPRRGDTIPTAPYAVAKWAATAYARMFYRLWDMPVTVLRIAMSYGPGQRDTTKLLPYVTLSLLSGQEPALTSGTRLLDWVYVDDVVDAFLAAAQSRRSAGEVLDIGTGTPVSIRDTVELLIQLMRSPLRPRYGAIPDRPLDGARIADIGPAARVIDWRPTVGLEDGLHRTLRWYADTLAVIPPRARRNGHDHSESLLGSLTEIPGEGR
jgi:UDP-glucose 4-epimerase